MSILRASIGQHEALMVVGLKPTESRSRVYVGSSHTCGEDTRARTSKSAKNVCCSKDGRDRAPCGRHGDFPDWLADSAIFLRRRRFRSRVKFLRQSRTVTPRSSTRARLKEHIATERAYTKLTMVSGNPNNPQARSLTTISKAVAQAHCAGLRSGVMVVGRIPMRRRIEVENG